MIITTVLAGTYYYNRRYDEAIATARSATEMTSEIVNPSRGDLLRGWRERGEVGYWEAAARIYQKLLAAPGQERGPTVPVAVAFLHVGDRERAFEWLERSIEQRTAGIYPDAFVDPALDALRGDPRFQRLNERIGLPSDAGSR